MKPDLADARSLVLRFGWNATVYQILNPGLELWFSAAGDAVVGYVTYASVRVVAGAPVCSRSRLQAVAAEFEQDAADREERVCYFCAEARLEALYRGATSHSMVSLGAQPVWDPVRLSTTFRAKASLRAQLHRAANKGVVVKERPRGTTGDTAILAECLEQWLEAKGLPPLHFLVEPWTIERLIDRRVFIAHPSHCDAGETDILGFLVASPVPARKGWLVEQIVRRPNAPNGTAELMLQAAARALADDSERALLLTPLPLCHRRGFWRRLSGTAARPHCSQSRTHRSRLAAIAVPPLVSQSQARQLAVRSPRDTLCLMSMVENRGGVGGVCCFSEIVFRFSTGFETHASLLRTALVAVVSPAIARQHTWGRHTWV